jgi:hypothetical protein
MASSEERRRCVGVKGSATGGERALVVCVACAECAEGEASESSSRWEMREAARRELAEGVGEGEERGDERAGETAAEASDAESAGGRGDMWLARVAAQWGERGADCDAQAQRQRWVVEEEREGHGNRKRRGSQVARAACQRLCTRELKHDAHFCSPPSARTTSRLRRV